jgi:Holliday junction resolvasome RuvABC ATP-dependent DNA helicase subunit
LSDEDDFKNFVQDFYSEELVCLYKDISEWEGDEEVKEQLAEVVLKMLNIRSNQMNSFEYNQLKKILYREIP